MTIYKIDRTIAQISNRLSFLAVNPTNIKLEKKKVFKDKHYDPEFHYRPQPKNLLKLRWLLRRLKIPETVAGKLLHEKRIELLKQVYLIKSIGTKEFTKHSIAIYDKPSKALLQQAHRYLDLPRTKDNGASLNKVSIIKRFSDVCAEHKFTCEIIAKEMAVSAAVSPAKKKVYFNPEKTFTENDLKRLAVHEIGTHIKRAENGKQQRLKLFTIGFPYYLATEEGFAVYNEEQAKVLTNDMIRQYAGRVIAVDLALKNSFSVVYTQLLDHFTPEQAYTLALRVKRGLKKTQYPGGYTKDHIYLKGWHSVKHFVQNGGKIKDLYTGKVSLEHVPVLKHLQRELENNI